MHHKPHMLIGTEMAPLRAYKKMLMRLTAFFAGYAFHPECGRKIYRPFSKYVPGRCSQCGARINMPCNGPGSDSTDGYRLMKW